MRNRKEFADKLSLENGSLMVVSERILDGDIDDFMVEVSWETNKFVNDLTYKIFGLLGGKINSEVEEKWEVVHQEIIDEVMEKLRDSIT